MLKTNKTQAINQNPIKEMMEENKHVTWQRKNCTMKLNLCKQEEDEKKKWNVDEH
jgi:hypothetical protein